MQILIRQYMFCSLISVYRNINYRKFVNIIRSVWTEIAWKKQAEYVGTFSHRYECTH